uniref:Uncharacterized protein n=1 Tax=Anguilla anguilla TaxID=7936 RepID=A0A0E9QUE8_ANGAN
MSKEELLSGEFLHSCREPAEENKVCLHVAPIAMLVHSTGTFYIYDKILQQ